MFKTERHQEEKEEKEVFIFGVKNEKDLKELMNAI